MNGEVAATKQQRDQLTASRRAPSPEPRTTELPSYRLPSYRATQLPNYRTTDLKHHPHADLRLPRRRHGVRMRPKSPAALAVGRAGERDQLGDAEVGAVEQVEHLDAEFEASVAAERRPAAVLLNARSTVRRSGPLKSPRPVLPNVPAGCSTNAAGLNHCSGVPFTALSGAIARRVARAILADAGAARRLPLRARAVGLHEHRQRLPAPHRRDARHLPAGDERARRRRLVSLRRTAGPS